MQIIFTLSIICSLIFGAVAGLILLIVQGIGLAEMSQKLDIKNKWMCFIPFFNLLIMGNIADKYEKKNGKKASKLSLWMILLSVIMILAVIIFFAVAFVNTASAISGPVDEDSVAINLFSSFLPMIVMYAIAFITAIIFNIIYYIALWRIFAIFNYNNSTVFLVLSIIFSFLAPIFIFIIRKKEPMLSSFERSGAEPIAEVIEINNSEDI